MSSTYPRRFSIETPDGEGEARKAHQGAAWVANFPTGALRFFGSAPEVQSEIRNYLRSVYGGGSRWATPSGITFGPTEPETAYTEGGEA